MTTLSFLGIMPLGSYGDLARLPPEVRDLIYREYFSVATSTPLERYLENNKAEAILYFNQPNTSILKVSRALYRDIQPFWKKYSKGHKLFRITTSVSMKQTVPNETFLTLSAEALSIPPFIRGMDVTWIYWRWLQSPRARANRDLERARIAFPDLGYFLKTAKNEVDRSTELFAIILGLRFGRVPGRLNIFIEDAKWPLPQPGEHVWYKRLHQGMTRRSLKKLRKNELDAIIKHLSDIISRFQKLVTMVTFTCGHGVNSRYRDNTDIVRRIVVILQQRLQGTVISFEL